MRYNQAATRRNQIRSTTWHLGDCIVEQLKNHNRGQTLVLPRTKAFDHDIEDL